MSKKNKNKSDNQDEQEQTKTTDKLDESVEQLDTKNLDEPTREELEDKVTQLSDDLKRSQADFLNLKRRSTEERASQAQRIKSELMKSLLPIIDSLERAVEQKPDDFNNNDWANGVDSICKQMHKALQEYGVTKIDAVGAEFDPNLHEAVTVDEQSKGEKEVVAEEIQPGYKIGDRVVRHAMVVVGKK